MACLWVAPQLYSLPISVDSNERRSLSLRRESAVMVLWRISVRSLCPSVWRGDRKHASQKKKVQKGRSKKIRDVYGVREKTSISVSLRLTNRLFPRVWTVASFVIQTEWARNGIRILISSTPRSESDFWSHSHSILVPNTVTSCWIKRSKRLQWIAVGCSAIVRGWYQTYCCIKYRYPSMWRGWKEKSRRNWKRRASPKKL